MTVATLTPQPFQLPAVKGNPIKRGAIKIATPVIEKMLRLSSLNDLYSRVHTTTSEDDHFASRVLQTMGITMDLNEEQLANIPKTGPLVVVANYPIGGIEGLMLIHLLRQVRPDVKVMANYLLKAIPELREDFFFVDPFDGPNAAKSNLRTMRNVIDWVKDDHALAVFPAGEVSHYTFRNRTVVDPAWDQTIARIVKRTSATVVPVYFHGRNSRLFNILGMIHPRLRTIMLPTEQFKKEHSSIKTIVGSKLSRDRLERFDQPDELISYMRVRTYMLKQQLRVNKEKVAQDQITANRNMQPIVEPIAPTKLADDVESLPEEQCLAENTDFKVFHASADQIPHVLAEIGRLREITFRKMGEGTSRSTDLDHYDEYYQHLFVWNKEKAEVVGAYRMGLTDEIIKAHGIEGLYTSSLFEYHASLFEQISPAIELGRSFVRPEYQRSFSPLMLLWKGISQYSVRHPRYARLLGPVSISAECTSMSKHLLMSFLNMNTYLPALGKLLKAKNPPQIAPPREIQNGEFSTVVRDLNEVNELIGDLEADGKQMPVLLRQYLKLNAVLLGFNVDPDFGDVLDGLMYVDMTKINRMVLNRYMGKADAKQFLEYHGINSDSPPQKKEEREPVSD